MAFCDDAQYEEFMTTVPDFERMLLRSGITLLKHYLDISRAEQKARLKARQRDPLKQWKASLIDNRAFADKNLRGVDVDARVLLRFDAARLQERSLAQ